MSFVCLFVFNSLGVDEDVHDNEREGPGERDQHERVDPGQQQLTEPRHHVAQTVDERTKLFNR